MLVYKNKSSIWTHDLWTECDMTSTNVIYGYVPVCAIFSHFFFSRDSQKRPDFINYTVGSQSQPQISVWLLNRWAFWLPYEWKMFHFLVRKMTFDVMTQNYMYLCKIGQQKTVKIQIVWKFIFVGAKRCKKSSKDLQPEHLSRRENTFSSLTSYTHQKRYTVHLQRVIDFN